MISNIKYAGDTIAGDSSSYNATGSLSSLPTCIGLHAKRPFEINLYLLKSVPMTFATDGIKYLSMFIPRRRSVSNSLLRISTNLI